MARRNLFALLTIVLVTSVDAFAAPQARLIKDINATLIANPSSFPARYVAWNGAVYFTASDPLHGNELRRTDLSVGGATLVADIRPGPASSSANRLVAAGSHLYFTADDGNGSRLWQTDGTAAGTIMTPGMPADAIPVMEYANRIVCIASDAAAGREMWITDGTIGGASVLDLVPGASASNPAAVGSFQGYFYFQASTPVAPFGSFQRGLWRTDFTSTGTAIIAQNFPGEIIEAIETPSGEIALGVVANVRSPQLWLSDGQPGGSMTPLREWNYSPAFRPGPREMTLVGTQLFYFVITDDYFGPSGSMWMTDLQTGITTELASGSNLGYIEAVGSGVIFSGELDSAGWEPWISDGTVSGTTRLIDLRPGSQESRPLEFTRVGNEVVFSADDGTGREVWRTDGTAAGTQQVTNLTAASGFSFFGYFLNDPATGRGIFSASSDALGQEPYAYVPSATGGAGSVVNVADINPQPLITSDSNPGSVIELFGRTLFWADDGIHGGELWTTDGTRPGTQLVIDLTPGPDGTPVRQSARVGDVVLFAVGDEVWRTDGTAAGTTLVRAIRPGSSGPGSSIFWFVVSGRTLYFAANDGTHGTELWRSDGTSAGTFMVADANPGPIGINPRFLTVVGDTVFFTGVDASGEELWSSRGTAATTQRIADLYPGPRSSEPRNLTAAGDELVFSAASPATGTDLWRSDGTTNGTRPFELEPGAGTASISEMTTAGDHLFVSAFRPFIGQDLYVTTLPLGGPIRPMGVNNGSFQPNLRSLTAVGNRLMFSARGSSSGESELWRSDGTAAGTFQVIDLAGSSSSSPSSFVVTSADTLFFSARTGQSRTELWKSDGTAAGTTRILAADSVALALGLGGRELLAMVDDPAVGRELWAIRPGASSYRVGDGCGTGLRTPRLDQVTPAIGQTMTIRGYDAPVGATGAALFGDQAAPLPIFGCDWYLGLGPVVALPSFTVTSPTWQTTLTLPNNPTLQGLRMSMQAIFAGTAGFEFTNGVHLHVGN